MSWTMLAPRALLSRRVLRRPPLPLAALARRSWEIAPAESAIRLPALALPGQVERVTGWAFTTHNPAPAMVEREQVRHTATRGYLIEDAWLIDGTLYRGRGSLPVAPRASRWPRLRVEREIARAALYGTFPGNTYFGQWLLDDCLTYPLAAEEGVPLTSPSAFQGHASAYEHRLGMVPERPVAARIGQLVVFDDVGQNRHKSRRFREVRRRLLGAAEPAPHPGVFLLRGKAGQRRVLSNEPALAEHLALRRGFTILDPMTADLPTIIAACAGARIVVGVEGSQLLHGMMLMQDGTGLLTLQPPNRFVGVLKDVTDRENQHFGFVVGRPDGSDFSIDPDEVERTLDLFPA